MENANNFDGLPSVAVQFLSYKQTIQGGSRLTAIEYALDLKLFLRFVKASRDKLNLKTADLNDVDISKLDMDFIRDIGADDIYSFLFYVSENRDNNAAARARKLAAIRAFFKYLTAKAGKLDVNPSENIDSPKVKKSLPKFLSLEESVKLLETVESDENNPNRLRDYAIITLFLNCGMRLAELVGIKLQDIDSDFKSVRILGKRNKERFVFLNDAAASALKAYIEKRSLMNSAKNENALFLSVRAQIDRSTVQKMIHKYFELAGLGDKHYSTHKLRHTSATLMYAHGGTDVRVLQEILGHENLNTTQIYTHVAGEQLRQAVESNPLAGLKIKKRRKQTDDKDE